MCLLTLSAVKEELADKHGRLQPALGDARARICAPFRDLRTRAEANQSLEIRQQRDFRQVQVPVL